MSSVKTSGSFSCLVFTVQPQVKHHCATLSPHLARLHHLHVTLCLESEIWCLRHSPCDGSASDVVVPCFQPLMQWPRNEAIMYGHNHKVQQLGHTVVL